MLLSAIIKQGMQKLKVLGAGETPTSQEYTDGVTVFNLLIDLWNAQRLAMYASQRSTFDLVASTASYNIGTGATWSTTRPIAIIDAGYIADPGASSPQEDPIKVFHNIQEYADVCQKSVGGQPKFLLYKPTFPNGVVTLYPVPDSSSADIALYLPVVLTEATDETTDIALPPGYKMALIYNWAVLVAGEYGVGVPPDVAALAAHTFEIVQRNNAMANIPILKTDYPANRSDLEFNINTGDWSH